MGDDGRRCCALKRDAPVASCQLADSFLIPRDLVFPFPLLVFRFFPPSFLSLQPLRWRYGQL